MRGFWLILPYRIIPSGGRYWVRTSDLFRVKEIIYENEVLEITAFYGISYFIARHYAVDYYHSKSFKFPQKHDDLL
jgi:hypothetical protein